MQISSRFNKYGFTKYKHDCDYRILIDRMALKNWNAIKSKAKELLEFSLYKTADTTLIGIPLKLLSGTNTKSKMPNLVWLFGLLR
jgi:hypothetical protein